MRSEDCISASGGPIGRGPVAVGEIAVLAGDLDHAVQRDVFDDFELSHCESPLLSLAIIRWAEEYLSHLARRAAGDGAFASPGQRFVHVGALDDREAANVFLGFE